MTNIEAGSAIASNIRSVKEKIAGAALVAGRKPDDIKLIAVSKTKSIDLIGEALEAGQRSFGENYVQEAVEKVAKLPSADWHFIGSLQTNKAKLVAGRFALIHSVDRVKLAEELDKAAGAAGVVQDVLLQVRVGEEDTKHGVSLDEAPRLISEILSRPNLRLKGVMSLPPLSDDESEARGYFQSVRSAFERWRDREFSDLSAKEAFTELSLGTSSDYEWAILEGATMVRVGTAIFGAREY